jgi:hypothetical protein
VYRKENNNTGKNKLMKHSLIIVLHVRRVADPPTVRLNPGLKSLYKLQRFTRSTLYFCYSKRIKHTNVGLPYRRTGYKGEIRYLTTKKVYQILQTSLDPPFDFLTLSHYIFPFLSHLSVSSCHLCIQCQ